MTDKGSSWPELVPIQYKIVEEITKLVDNYWSNQYSRPLYCIHDNGGEFIGTDFIEILKIYGVDSNNQQLRIHKITGCIKECTLYYAKCYE